MVGGRRKNQLLVVSSCDEEGRTTSPGKWTPPPHTCPGFESDWVGTAAPRSHCAAVLLHWAYSCQSPFVQCSVLHVISQPILEHECMGSNVKGSVHLTHPSALHQTPSVEPLCILRQPTRPAGTGVQGSERLCRWGSLHHIKGLKVGRTGWKTRAR